MSKGFLKDLSALNPGDHCLFIHDGLEEKTSLLTSFFKTGLQKGERCLALLDDLSMEFFCKSFSCSGIDIAEEKRRGRLILENSWQTYLDGTKFDPERMIGLWRNTLEKAKRDGYSVLRVAGDVNWAFGDNKNLEKLLDYEKKVKDVFDSSPILAVCLYERSLLTKDLLLEVLNSHPYVIQGSKVRKNTLFETHPKILGEISKRYEAECLKKSIVDYDDLASDKRSLDDFCAGIIDIIPTVFYRLLENGSTEFISSHVKDLTGYIAEEFYSGNRSLDGITHPEDKNTLKKNFLFREREEVASLYYRIVRKDGDIAWVHDLSRTFQKDGRIFSDGVLLDVTETKFAEEALRASEENFKALAANANDGILITVDGRRHVYANRRASIITGYSIDELLEMGIKDLAHPDTLALILERFKKRLKGEELPNQYETIIVRKDGTCVPIELTAAKTLWHGKSAIMAVFRDVSERKRIEEELSRSESRYRTLVEQLPDTSWVYLAETQNIASTIYVGPQVKSMGFTQDEWIKDKDRWQRQLHPEDRERVLSEFSKLTENKQPVRLEYRMLTRDGRVRWFMDEGLPLTDEKGGPILIQGLMIDITERKEAEKALKLTTERLKKAQHIAKMGSWEWDLTKNEIYWSDELYNIFGLSGEIHLTFEGFLKLIHPEDVASLKRAVESSLASGFPGGKAPYSSRHRLIRPDGSIRIMLAEGEAEFDSEGTPVRMAGTAHDITGRMLIEERLREAERKFSRMVENSRDAVLMADLETREFVYANHAALELLGYSYKELMRKTTRDVTDPSQWEEQKEQFDRFLKDGHIRVHDRIVVRKDGTKAWVDLSVFSLQSGGRKMSVGVFRDMTEYKKALDEIRRLEGLCKTVTFSIPSSIILHDSDFRVIFVNDRFLNITGLKIKDVLNKTPLEFLPPKMIKEMGIEEKLSFVKKKKKAWGPDYMDSRDLSGNEMVLKRSVHPICGERGELLYIMTVLDDVTEQKKAEDELLKRTEELKALNSELHKLTIELTNLEENERKQFAEVLHEGIGQNLVALKMSLEGFMKGCKKEDSEMKSTANQMLALLDESIKSTRAMTADLYPAPMKEMGLCGAVRWYVQTVVLPKGKKVSFEVGEDLEREMNNNKKELNRAAFHIIREALQNSMKYSSASDIKIKCSKEGGLMTLEVSDNGVGFDYGELRNHPGRGLGLMLMREWATAVNGRLSIKSAPGRGTEIRAEFPVDWRKK